ncbi:transposase [Pseudoxanthomonas suwonensis]|uniref:Transposase n=1 Tax=Pseudoxanthomonas suwonensis TaxID=314722 RepID=A0A0E3Z215_9GAMM|nr:transposase [Pseudoxanthomonas suwonensis]AKC87087.1 transposase [Pseudoxanthomonas suwonensis]
MARLPRPDVPGIPLHIVQRGNDRQPCFADIADYQRFLHELGEAALRHHCQLHAYVLMTNHVHLLATPLEPGGASRMMQAIGRRYVATFNTRHHRTGTLWEGRFKSALVDSERYVLACYRYIELNPVRAGITSAPGAYAWSSHACNAYGIREPRITPHPAYLALGSSDGDRQGAYRDLLAQGLPSEEAEALRLHTRQQKAWGSERFRRQMETSVLRSMESRPRGRPASIPGKCT